MTLLEEIVGWNLGEVWVGSWTSEAAWRGLEVLTLAWHPGSKSESRAKGAFSGFGPGYYAFTCSAICAY